jgi:hypothetical protein
MFNKLFNPTPGWISIVLQKGRLANATILSDPHSIWNSGGKIKNDEWLDLQVDIKPFEGENFITIMKCQVGQIIDNKIEKGMKVKVKFDPLNRRRAILVNEPLPIEPDRVLV